MAPASKEMRLLNYLDTLLSSDFVAIDETFATFFTDPKSNQFQTELQDEQSSTNTNYLTNTDKNDFAMLYPEQWKELNHKLRRKIQILRNIQELTSNADKKNTAAKFFSSYVKSDTNWGLARSYTALRKKFREELNAQEKILASDFAERIGDFMVLAFLLENIPDQDPDVLQVKQAYARDLEQYKQLLRDMGFSSDITAGINWNLKSEYDLELMSSLAGDINNAKDGKVYLNTNPNAYFVKGMKQSIFLPETIDLTNFEQKLKDAEFKKAILAITSKEGHTFTLRPATSASIWQHPLIQFLLFPINFLLYLIRLLIPNSWIVHTYQVLVNPFRLYFQRLRKLFFLLQPLLKQYEAYRRVLFQIEAGGTAVFFTFLSWVFFIPRLLVNTGLTLKHLFAPESDIEEELGWWVRLEAQLGKRFNWFINDGGWLSSGITNCFFLAGKIPAIGVYLAVAMQAYDLLNATLLLYVEINRLYDVEKGYKAANSLTDDDGFLEELKARRAFEWKVHAWSLFNFALLLTCACLIATSTNPIIPVIAAVIAVVITIIHGVVMRLAEAHRRDTWGLNTELVSCCSMTLSEPPNKDVDKKMGVFNKAYIRVINKEEDTLYYVKKVESKKDMTDYFGITKPRPPETQIINLSEKFDFKGEHLKKFDKIAGSSQEPKSITQAALKNILEIKVINAAEGDDTSTLGDLLNNTKQSKRQSYLSESLGILYSSGGRGNG